MYVHKPGCNEICINSLLKGIVKFLKLKSRIMKKIIILSFFIFLGICVFAQNAKSNDDAKFPSIPASPSPKAYEMTAM